MIKINDIVSYNCQYGVVVATCTISDRKMVTVHHIDPNTGEKMVCPDDRCKGRMGCPIHLRGYAEWEVEIFTTRDLDHYVAEGMVSSALVDKMRENRDTPKVRRMAWLDD